MKRSFYQDAAFVALFKETSQNRSWAHSSPLAVELPPFFRVFVRHYPSRLRLTVPRQLGRIHGAVASGFRNEKRAARVGSSGVGADRLPVLIDPRAPARFADRVTAWAKLVRRDGYINFSWAFPKRAAARDALLGSALGQI
jgi:hypothetical protein